MSDATLISTRDSALLPADRDAALARSLAMTAAADRHLLFGLLALQTA